MPRRSRTKEDLSAGRRARSDVTCFLCHPPLQPVPSSVLRRNPATVLQHLPLRYFPLASASLSYLRVCVSRCAGEPSILPWATDDKGGCNGETRWSAVTQHAEAAGPHRGDPSRTGRRPLSALWLAPVPVGYSQWVEQCDECSLCPVQPLPATSGSH